MPLICDPLTVGRAHRRNLHRDRTAAGGIVQRHAVRTLAGTVAVRACASKVPLNASLVLA